MKIKFKEKIFGQLFIKPVLQRKNSFELLLLARNDMEERDAKIIKYYAKEELIRRLKIKKFNFERSLKKISSKSFAKTFKELKKQKELIIVLFILLPLLLVSIVKLGILDNSNKNKSGIPQRLVMKAQNTISEPSASIERNFCTLNVVDCPAKFKPKIKTVTAYCLKGIMASGKRVYKGAIACPREIPLGTKVKIQNKIYTCEDRLSLRYDKRFDIWFSSCKDAINWGIKRLPVMINYKKANKKI